MQKDLENRAAKPKKRPAAPKKPEQAREIQYQDKRVTVEKCPSCGSMVRMSVYKTRDILRYCRCPRCGQHHAIRGDGIREL